jgi:GNAT superfamily N-acetyltransferase
VSDVSSHQPTANQSLGDDGHSARYPEELVNDIVVPTGVALRLRPIRRDDAERLVDFHSRLSPVSIYRRYFSLHPSLAEEEVSHLTQVDYVNRLALVVEVGSHIVAIGRYERLPSTTTGEVAFVVRDDFQHLGLGHLLLDQLAQAGWVRGITHFSAVTLVDNGAMIALFQHSGFPVTTSRRDEELTVSFPIDPSCRSVVAPPEGQRRVT